MYSMEVCRDEKVHLSKRGTPGVPSEVPTARLELRLDNQRWNLPKFQNLSLVYKSMLSLHSLLNSGTFVSGIRRCPHLLPASNILSFLDLNNVSDEDRTIHSSARCPLSPFSLK